MSDAEIALLDRVAGRVGRTRSAAIRSAVDAYDAATDGRRVKRETLGPKTRECVTRLTSEMNRIGVNVNQISRAANSGKVLPSDVDALLAELHRVQDQVHEVTAMINDMRASEDAS